jgi:hypothetical protein
MRSAVGQAQGAATTAANTGTQLGAEAQGIGSTLTPFLTSELEHPQGYSQQDQSAMLSAAEGGAGGADAGVVGKADQEAAQTHNAGGFAAVLDDAARQRTKAAAGTSEEIAADNAGVKTQQQQDAARGLQGMYGTDTSGMLDATGQEANDVNAEVNANKTGWLQNAEGVVSTLAQGAMGAGALGFKPGCWIAAEVYHGWLDPRVPLVRGWIFGEFAKTRVGALAARAYLRYGERVAAAIRRVPALRPPFRRLFDCALRKAVA